MHKLQIISIGESAGVILPEDVMARLGASGATRFASPKRQTGGYRLTMWSAEFEGQMGRKQLFQ